MPDERITLPIDALENAPWNPKSAIAREYRKGLIGSLDHFGVRDDLKVWPSPDHSGRYIVLDGNQRLDLLRESGVAEVECRVLADLDDDDARLFTASFDRNVARYDEAKLAALAGELKAKGAELVSMMLRPDAAIVGPPARPEGSVPDGEPGANAGLAATVPVMFSLTREGYEEVKGAILKTKARLKREERLVRAFAGFSERRIDDAVVELVLRIAAR
jgi:ParB-like chromosome segregation protein Spo0J